ncbi:MAG: hypothetical protein AAB547_03090, partial [Patescibacteria group bacterium]
MRHWPHPRQRMRWPHRAARASEPLYFLGSFSFCRTDASGDDDFIRAAAERNMEKEFQQNYLRT